MKRPLTLQQISDAKETQALKDRLDEVDAKFHASEKTPEDLKAVLKAYYGEIYDLDL